jgi:hypothetical protein
MDVVLCFSEGVLNPEQSLLQPLLLGLIFRLALLVNPEVDGHKGLPPHQSSCCN